MVTPESRGEFERNFYLLIEKIRQRKMFFPKGFDLGFTRVRRLPNGRIDLLSINEFTRMNANMAAQTFPEDLKPYKKEDGPQAEDGPDTSLSEE